MIVTCEGCSTRFQLDDERVPHGGIRVRCSCCKHAFFVKPVQTAGDPVARAVTEALHGDENAARHPARETGGGCGAEDDDWQFNHEPRADRVGTVSDAAWQAVDESLAAGDAPPASAPDADPEGFLSAGTDVDDDIDALLGNSAAVYGATTQSGEEEADLDRVESHSHASGSDAEVHPPGVLDAEAAAPVETEGFTPVETEGLAPVVAEAAAPVVAEAAAPVVAEAVAPVDTEGLAPVETEGLAPVVAEAAAPVVAEAAAPVDTEGFTPVETEGLAPVVAEAAAPVAAEAAEPTGFGDVLGSPESWDFFPSDEKTAHAAGGAPVPLARIALGASAAALPETRAPAAVDVEPSVVRRWLGGAANGVCWAATVGLIALLLQAGSRSPLEQTATQAPVAGLELENFRARRFDNAVIGPIRVVEGTLRSASGRSVRTQARLAVQLLDAQGAVVDDDAATLGPALSEWMLRELSPAQLHRRLERGAGWTLGPDATRSVVAVIDASPARAERFRIVAVPRETATASAESVPGDREAGS
ncbi:MAG: zinc-ribbon domain-containing protein [Myxococcota bacterium]|nr:zinc-ribbon domain-containing protein [Myxococcota bacterium]